MKKYLKAGLGIMVLLSISNLVIAADGKEPLMATTSENPTGSSVTITGQRTIARRYSPCI
jgi:hypothetical protein